MPNFILSIDQGTTSSRAVLFDDQGKVVAKSQTEFEQHFPQDGWVEHKPNDILTTVVHCAKDVMAKSQVDACDVRCVGITNQRETTVVWDKNTGEAIYNAIVWQDRRTGEKCRELVEQGYEATVSAKTGLLLDPYFSASKLQWVLDHVEGARKRAERGELAFGTIDTFLLWHLTQGHQHATDATNASRTLLFNIHDQCWDDELLALFNIPKAILPEVKDSADDFGVTDPTILGQAIPITAMIGDQQAALFGQTCFEKGMAKSTYGTGCFLMLNTGDKAIQSTNRLLSTVAYRLNGKTTYALEGSIFMAGATVQWLRDGLEFIKDASETQAIAEKTPIDHGVFLVPAFTGLGAPFWDPNARGAIVGLTRDSGIKEIVSAGLQSVCYQTKDLQKAMESDGVRPTSLQIDGGMSQNDWTMQFLADILGANISRCSIMETTALGCAYLAGLQAGIFDSLSQISKLWHQDKLFTPTMLATQRNGLYQQWLTAVERVKTQ
ncbi:glycerol kinase GlpK [Psychrobium sp. nBUS_13]|uniref:glycerol kinase GlpK n=1 Tax=Psychrobium sp. nBUS_13 TaxID=3395319 RepID=UPI003EBD6BEB